MGQLNLRSFMYLDESILNDFLAQIEGGLLDGSITEKVTKTKGMGGSLKLGIPPFVGSVGGNSSATHEFERQIMDAAPARFQRLYSYLETYDLVHPLDNFDLATYSGLNMHEIVEVRGSAKVPTWDELSKEVPELQQLETLEQQRPLLIEAAGVDDHIWEFQAALDEYDRLRELKASIETLLIIEPLYTHYFRFIAKLTPKFLLRKDQYPPIGITILGKIMWKLEDNETLDVMQLVSPTTQLGSLKRDHSLINAHPNGGFDKLISTASIIRYPEIQLLPIALYW